MFQCSVTTIIKDGEDLIGGAGRIERSIGWYWMSWSLRYEHLIIDRTFGGTEAKNCASKQDSELTVVMNQGEQKTITELHFKDHESMDRLLAKALSPNRWRQEKIGKKSPDLKDNIYTAFLKPRLRLLRSRDHGVYRRPFSEIDYRAIEGWRADVGVRHEERGNIPPELNWKDVPNISEVLYGRNAGGIDALPAKSSLSPVNL
ncbi:hypothetical protein BJ138DRAFT_1107894 [Hygrophoropsis aurantiaca]|uniref:Uncharacterized protein n=1 Tax=Hygrophoropsis aurantiaca TaxID=72124 RepID=A0ACB7ZQ27_9AGAM|nr:hypothetical protein BJ138DRAFT_1107894 [Hygrophoropsis aurantiaca]